MKRIGYDSDLGRYFFRDKDGSIWQGEEGAEFSEMTKVSSGTTRNSSDSDIEAAPPARSDGYQRLDSQANFNYSEFNSATSPYRTLFPFFLMIAVVLMLIWRLIVSPFMLSPERGSPTCSSKDMKPYWVQPGDTCWEISRAHGCSLDQLKDANHLVDCKHLMPGMTMCLPSSTSTEPSPASTDRKKRRP